MSVAPDFLLQSAPDTRPKAAAAKPPTNSSEPKQGKASSFSDVYAKERQSKAAERKDDTTKMAKGSGDSTASKGAAPTAAAADKPAVAESGKVLPDDEVDKEPDVTDPLLLLGLNPLLPVEEAGLPKAEVPTETADALLPGGAGALLASSGLTGATVDTTQDPELDLLEGLPGMRQSLEMNAQGQQPLSPGALAAQKAVDPTEGDFNSKLAALSGVLDENKEGKDDSAIGERLASALEIEQPKSRESLTDARTDALASRLSALSQAISQQNNVTPRTQLVPGQPLAMQQGGWSEAVVDRVMWLSSQNLKSAEIQLDPAELGRMEVRIDMRQDQTQVTFISAHAGVREQLEGQVHRLREMFIQQGMDQPNVNVGDQSMSRGWQGGDDARQHAHGSNGTRSDGDEEQLVGVSEIRAGTTSTSRGLVDYYA
ncbi:flagellar hook-length control protein FliK [Aquipseudomonas campi]